MKQIIDNEVIDGSVNSGLTKIPTPKKQNNIVKIIFIVVLALTFLATIIFSII